MKLAEALILLDDLADQLATVIPDLQLRDENIRVPNGMVGGFRQRERSLQRRVQQGLAERGGESHPVLEGIGEKEMVSLVEDALRRLHDFSYLGEHSLAQLQVVDWWLEESRKRTFVTHIDRGKALSDIIIRTLNKLRPEGEEPSPHVVPSPGWRQFIVLHDSYALDEMNRDIMSRLYIGEGTFNRIRRRALRSVAKALLEMEQEARTKWNESELTPVRCPPPKAGSFGRPQRQAP